jgi:glycosyltransferase involved in cell wall biosynthesis
MKPLLSVVVPVFNAEKYLAECVESLLSQTYGNIEYIFINDGSTDSCPEILRGFAAKDGRVSVYTTDNRGYGAACNLGLSRARGGYAAVFESDDFCERDFYADLIGIAEDRGCDLVKSDYYELRGGVKKRYSVFPEKLYGRVLTPADETGFNFFNIRASIWSAVYRSDLIKKLGFLETPGAAYQDTSFSAKALMYSGRAYFLDRAYVNYRLHDGQSVKKTSDPYAVMSEFREIERCFGMNPKLLAAKWNICRWNYRRLGTGHKLPFLRRCAAEFGRDAGFIDPEYMGWDGIVGLRLLLADPREYHRLFARPSDVPAAAPGAGD